MLDAYGWPADLSDDEVLARLLALNQARAASPLQGADTRATAAARQAATLPLTANGAPSPAR